jgi:hypothetical protein
MPPVLAARHRLHQFDMEEDDEEMVTGYPISRSLVPVIPAYAAAAAQQMQMRNFQHHQVQQVSCRLVTEEGSEMCEMA